MYILLYGYGLSLLGIAMVVATFFSDARVCLVHIFYVQQIHITPRLLAWPARCPTPSSV